MRRYYHLSIDAVGAFLQKHTQSIFLDTARPDKDNRYSYLFVDPRETLYFTAKNSSDLLRAIDDKSKTFFLAGHLLYEFGYVFNPRLSHLLTDAQSLGTLGVFDTRFRFDHFTNTWDPYCPLEKATQQKIEVPVCSIQTPTFSTSKHEYEEAFTRVKKYLEDGYTYQVNLTAQGKGSFTGTSWQLYKHLREKQRTAFCVYSTVDQNPILSFSPELFFRKTATKISTKPMKGTAKRGRTLEEDKEIQQELALSEKNRAENIMIVDLLRNDLGAVCTEGSVRVEKLCEIETYPTVLQMTSTITGIPMKNVHITKLLTHLFPCGSITGAPKEETMKIIADVEKEPRGIYCGAIGFIGPKKEASFNVAIRTLQCENNHYTYGSGGGITVGSTAKDEYEELLLKASFLPAKDTEPSLIASLLWDGKRYTFEEAQKKRMHSSAEYFCYPWSTRAWMDCLHDVQKKLTAKQHYKIRVLLSPFGEFSTEAEPIPSTWTPTGKITFSQTPMDASNRFLYHKTTRREWYGEELKKALNNGFDDVLFCNERGEITEGARSNIFIKKEGVLYTPPISCGLLPGVYRDVLLKKKNTVEKVLYANDLNEADAIYLTNAVRGMWKVTISKNQIRGSKSQAN